MIDDRGRIGREARDHLAFGTRDAFEAAESCQMLGAGIGDDADGGAADAHQGRYLTGPIRTHLHDREAMFGARSGTASAARRCDC